MDAKGELSSTSCDETTLVGDRWLSNPRITTFYGLGSPEHDGLAAGWVSEARQQKVQAEV